MSDPSDDPGEALRHARPAEPAEPNDLLLSGLDRNDLGNGARLRARHGADLLYVKEWAKEAAQAWLHWRPNGGGGGIWERDAWLAAKRLAHRTAEAIKEREVPAIKAALRRDLEEAGPKERETLTKRWSGHADWGRQSGNQGRISAMLDAAAPYCETSSEELDADPLAFGCANGALRLPPPCAADGGGDGAGEGPIDAVLYPARRADRMTKASPIAWDPAAAAPKFTAFLATILPDPEVRAFLQRFFGYCLTGLITEQVILMLYGNGGNGKSTLLNIIKGVLGTYAIGLPFESFLATDRSGGQPTPDLARLPGTRLATASEPEVGARLSEAVIKSHTGGERVAVRPLYGWQYEFLPSHKTILSFNPKPKIIGQDDGIWRRIALVHFQVKLSGPKPPRPFDQIVVEEEGAGVLRWLVDGYLQWRELGLAMPAAVQEATASYRAESNVLADFLDYATVRAAESRVQAGTLYQTYKQWASLNGTEPISAVRFGKEIEERGFVRKLISGRRFYVGMHLDGAALDEMRAEAESDRHAL